MNVEIESLRRCLKLNDNLDNRKRLFNLAWLFLESIGLSKEDWTLGGGTTLMLHYNHRISNDIDIFFSDAQYITYLTPRLNDTVSQYVDSYNEQSNSLKLIFEFGEIDFIVAPRLTPEPYVILNIEGKAVNTESPQEIAIKKIFYRAETLKARDIIDIAVVVKNCKDSLLKYLNIYSSKVHSALERLDIIRPNYKEALRQMEIINKELVDHAPDIVEEFLKECIKRVEDAK